MYMHCVLSPRSRCFVKHFWHVPPAVGQILQLPCSPTGSQNLWQKIKQNLTTEGTKHSVICIVGIVAHNFFCYIARRHNVSLTFEKPLKPSTTSRSETGGVLCRVEGGRRARQGLSLVRGEGEGRGWSQVRLPREGDRVHGPDAEAQDVSQSQEDPGSLWEEEDQVSYLVCLAAIQFLAWNPIEHRSEVGLYRKEC